MKTTLVKTIGSLLYLFFIVRWQMVRCKMLDIPNFTVMRREAKRDSSCIVEGILSVREQIMTRLNKYCRQDSNDPSAD